MNQHYPNGLVFRSEQRGSALCRPIQRTEYLALPEYVVRVFIVVTVWALLLLGSLRDAFDPREKVGTMGLLDLFTN